MMSDRTSPARGEGRWLASGLSVIVLLALLGPAPGAVALGAHEACARVIGCVSGQQALSAAHESEQARTPTVCAHAEAPVASLVLSVRPALIVTRIALPPPA